MLLWAVIATFWHENTIKNIDIYNVEAFWTLIPTESLTRCVAGITRYIETHVKTSGTQGARQST